MPPHQQLELLDLLEKDVVLSSNIITTQDTYWESALEYFSNTLIFGLDIETFGEGVNKKSDALNPFKGFIRLITVSLDNGLVILIDLGGWNNKDNSYGQPIFNFLSILSQKLTDPSTLVIGQNLKFDCVFLLEKFGFKTRNIRDLMLMSQVMWSGIGIEKAKPGEDRSERCKLSHSLKAIAERLGYGDIDKALQKSNFGWDLTNAQLNYAAKDAAILLPLYYKLRDLLIEHNLIYSASSECLAAPVFIEMEHRGFDINEQELNKAIMLYQQAQAETLIPWKAEFPRINWASPTQVATALNQRYNLNLEKADDDALKDLPYESAKAILDARSLNVSLKYLESIKENMFRGSIRSKFTQIAASGSGRSASRNINLQNPAKLLPEHEARGLPSVRSVFAAAPGYKLIVADLSQAHARIAAEMSQDSTLFKAYNKGLDNHLVMATKLLEAEGYKWSQDQVISFYDDKNNANYKKIKDARNKGKTGFYAFLNQSGASRLQITFRGFGINVTLEECETLKKLLRTTYKGLYKFIIGAIQKANLYNYKFDNFKDRMGYPLRGVYGEIRGLTGRRQYCKKAASKFRENNTLEVLFTDSISYMWLSSEADIIKTAMGKILLKFDKNPHWQAHFANFAHDELDIVCKEEYALITAQTVMEIIHKELQRWIRTIPVDDVTASPEKLICTNWSEK